MNKARTPKLLEVIESDPQLAVMLVKNQDGFRKLLLQIQLELVTEENKDTLGHTMFAVKEIYDIFDMVIAKGEALIQESQKKEQKKGK